MQKTVRRKRFGKSATFWSDQSGRRVAPKKNDRTECGVISCTVRLENNKEKGEAMKQWKAISGMSTINWLLPIIASTCLLLDCAAQAEPAALQQRGAGAGSRHQGRGADFSQMGARLGLRPQRLCTEFAPGFSAWLNAEAVKSRKQRRTLKQMFLDLKELGYEGSYDRVATFGRQWKAGQMARVNSASKSTSWVLPPSKPVSLIVQDQHHTIPHTRPPRPNKPDSTLQSCHARPAPTSQ